MCLECLFCLLLSSQLIMAQNCSIISTPEVKSLLQIYHPSTDGQLELILVDYNVTCLSHSILENHYRSTTISVKYINLSSGFQNNETFVALIDIGCSQLNEWDPTVLGRDNAFMWSEAVPSYSLRSDCRMCISGSHSELGNISDPQTHCVGELLLFSFF